MSEYFWIEPIGLGAVDVECFSSYLCRLAHVHNLSTTTFPRHLSAWWARQPQSGDRGLSFIAIAGWLNGYSPAAEHVRRVVEKATGFSELGRTSLSELAHVGSRNSMGFVRRNRAWCPACIDEDLQRGEFCYERLLWTLPNISRCPDHKVLLHDSCAKCGVPQRFYHVSGSMSICWKCGEDLRYGWKEWAYQPNPSFCESQCIELVESIGDGRLKVVEDAFQIFAREIRANLGDKRRNYAKVFGSTYCKHVRREQIRPSFRMMLQQSHALGVTLVQILGDPKGAARAAGVLALTDQINLDIRRERLSPRKIREIETRLHHDIEVAIASELVSLRALSRQLQVSTGAIEGRFASLVRLYQAKRKSAVAAHIAECTAKVLAALDDGLLRDYQERRIRSVDALARCISQQTGVGIRAARLGIAARLNPAG